MTKKPKRMKQGMRILADPKFNRFDGSWDDRDFARLKHQLFGIVTMDIYTHYERGKFDRHITIPDYVCDARMPGRPEQLHLRDKRQPAITKRLWCYHSEPAKARKLFKFIVDVVNGSRKDFKQPPVKAKDESYALFSFLTIASTGNRCLWRITERTKDEANQPVKYPILAEIDGSDAGLFDYTDQIEIAGDMVMDECQMENKRVSTLACALSGLT